MLPPRWGTTAPPPSSGAAPSVISFWLMLSERRLGSRRAGVRGRAPELPSALPLRLPPTRLSARDDGEPALSNGPPRARARGALGRRTARGDQSRRRQLDRAAEEDVGGCPATPGPALARTPRKLSRRSPPSARRWRTRCVELPRRPGPSQREHAHRLGDIVGGARRRGTDRASATEAPPPRRHFLLRGRRLRAALGERGAARRADRSAGE